MLPNMRISIEAPEPLLTEGGFVRLHNQVAKTALREEAVKHWKDRIPGHFDPRARGKYGHMKRKPKYEAMKQRVFGRVIDLVLTGQTRSKITKTQPEIRMGGSALGGKNALSLTMTMRLPFGLEAQKAHATRATRTKQGIQQRPARTRPGVTIAQMKTELAAITEDERRAIAASFRQRYLELLNKELRSRPKIRKQIESATPRSAMVA
jgi:hypothetical protein